MKSKTFLPLGLLMAVFAVIALGQQDAVFTTGVDVVNVLATVRDRHGRLVNDLEMGDFLLNEDGKPQVIRYFSRQTDLPLTVGVLVDTSLSQRRLIEQERSASYEFFRRVVDETKDQAFVIRFDFEVELLRDLTSSKQLLQEALERLSLPNEPRFRTRPQQQYQQQFPGGGIPGGRTRGPFPRDRRGGSGSGGPVPGSRPGAVGTALYDAVYLAASEVLHDQAGRKAIVLISDGVDVGSKVGAEEAIEAAHRADAVIYSVFYSDEEGYQMRAGGRPGAGAGGWRPNGEYALESLCKQTGGRIYKLSDELTLARVFEQIEDELRNQYSIGYTPINDSESTGFRRISLTVQGDDKLKAYTRAGYYPKGGPAE